MDICVDFDGTCVKHAYPQVGENIGAEVVLRKLVDADHRLVLFTMRSGKELQDAIDWFEAHDIPLYGVNENPTQKQWTESPKAFGQLYIDDAALGAPLVLPKDSNERPWIDWYLVANMFGL